MQNTQFVKAAIISSRLPPAVTQATKIGINKIEHYVTLQGKGKQSLSIKEESHDSTNSCSGKYINSSDGEQMSDSESAKPSSGKSMTMYERISSTSNGHTNIQSDDMLVQSNILSVREADANSSHNVVPHNHLPRLNVPQGANVSTQKRIEQPQQQQQQPTVCNIKIERNVDVYDYLETRELQYYEDAANDSSVVSPTKDSHNKCTLKRICSEEDLTTMRAKKRSNDAYASTNGNEMQQSISYMNCRTTFVSQKDYPSLTVEFNRCNSQQLMTAESPSSCLHDVAVEYQQLVSNQSTAPLVITNPEEEHFSDLQDLKNDTLLSPELDANSGTATVSHVYWRSKYSVLLISVERSEKSGKIHLVYTHAGFTWI